MSHLRSRNTKNSQSLYIQKKKAAHGSQTPYFHPQKHNQSTLASLLTIPNHKNKQKNHQDSLYNKNIFQFRQIFNQNDQSQLPFMSSLRQHPKNGNPPQATTHQPFQVAMKTTCNQTMRKKISDFKTPSRRLATSYYRWHNKSGRHSLWSTEFECSLRDYGESPDQKRYSSYIKPIVYKDYQRRTYNKEEMICDRHSRSFTLK